MLSMAIDVKLLRVPQEGTSNGKPGKVHVMVNEVSLHDLAQGTTDAKRWPWKHDVERVGLAEFAESPCQLCKSALEGTPLHGNV